MHDLRAALLTNALLSYDANFSVARIVGKNVVLHRRWPIGFAFVLYMPPE